MYNLEDFLALLEQVAPLSISHKVIEQGGYDNSGIIVKSTDKVEKVLFSLDCSVASVEKAIELGCDTLVTHHPAIYRPVKSLGLDTDTVSIVTAISKGINIISIHLNLDMADSGIDQSLAEGLGAEQVKVLDYVDGAHGYGREFIANTDTASLKNRIKEVFKTDKAVFYGDGYIKKIASFCGSGGENAIMAIEKGITDADTVVTSDIPHHFIKKLIECGKKVVLLPHYVSEQFGFERFYNLIKDGVKEKAQIYYYLDERFM